MAKTIYRLGKIIGMIILALETSARLEWAWRKSPGSRILNAIQRQASRVFLPGGFATKLGYTFIVYLILSVTSFTALTAMSVNITLVTSFLAFPFWAGLLLISWKAAGYLVNLGYGREK